VSGFHLLDSHDIKAQVLKGKSNVLGRSVHWKTSNYCSERFIRFDVKGKMDEVIFIEIGQHGVVVGHTAGN
jgi:hypothetical protein